MRHIRWCRLLAATAAVVVVAGCSRPPSQEVEDAATGDETPADDEADSDEADDEETDDEADSDEADDAETDEDDDGPQVPPLHARIDGYGEAIVELVGEEVEVEVHAKVATTVEEHGRGLMEVEELPDGIGMLFVFEEERRSSFWMKDTYVPLDIAFAAANGTILRIMTMDPCEVEECPTYDPEVEFATALEVPAGWFSEVGIEEGDELDIGDIVPAE